MSCNCTFKTDIEVINQIKEKGFDDLELATKHQINCACNQEFIMDKCLVVCPNCQSIYGVTPCKQADIENVVCVKNVDY